MNKSQKNLAKQYIEKFGDEAFAEALKPPPNKRQTKIWPKDYVWWQKDRLLQKLAWKYKYLLPLLSELKALTALHQNKNHTIGIEPFEVSGEKKEYVLLDLSNRRAGIADRIGCSEKTVGNYIRGLCKIGLMMRFKKGRRTFYAFGEWGVMPSEQDKSEFVPRKIIWLTEATSRKLYKFKPQYK